MANVKVGDIVRITSGRLFGTVCFVRNILRGCATSGSDLYLLSSSLNKSSCWYAYYEDDEFRKLGV